MLAVACGARSSERSTSRDALEKLLRIKKERREY